MRIGNVDLHELKEKYGTPLYIYDSQALKANMELYNKNFVSDKFETEVLFASKAFSCKEMLRLVMCKNLSLDVVSLGELYTANIVGFPMEKVYFHGNNKSLLELKTAINYHVGYIVVDNLMELEAINKLAFEMKEEVNILIRLNLGIEAHTHKFIVTSHIDSKFGVLYNSSDFKEMLRILENNRYVSLCGFHSHIGSQIFDLEAFSHALEKLLDITTDFKEELILNIGGGFGVHYTDLDKPIPFDIVSKTLINVAETTMEKKNTKIKRLCIEPGRSIVAEAGYTLYEIGYTKKTPNKQYYFIDGGMTDNIRPALYQAKYSCDIVDKENEEKTEVVTIAGKCCESGDLIIENVKLPKASTGDLLITYTTGAYGYSMSSNYNKALTPAVVFVDNGKSKLAIRRQTLEELIEREI